MHRCAVRAGCTFAQAHAAAGLRRIAAAAATPATPHAAAAAWRPPLLSRRQHATAAAYMTPQAAAAASVTLPEAAAAADGAPAPVTALAAAAAAAPRAPRAHRGLTSLTLAGFDLDAVSMGGQETCICVPSLKLAFDIGRCPQRACHMEHLFLSHCHMDHVGGAGFHAATRSMLGLTPPAVFVPAASAPALEARGSASPFAPLTRLQRR